MGKAAAPKRWLPALVAAGLLAVGAGAFLVGSAPGGVTARRDGTSYPVNPGARDRRDIRAHNSPTVVRSPSDQRVLVVVNRIDTPRFACALHLSGDAGRTWSEVKVPVPAGEEDPPRCFGPDAAFGADGILYVSFVTLEGPGNLPHAAWVVTSTDGGRSFSTPVRALGPLAFQVRLLADPYRGGRLYLSWLQARSTRAFGFGGTRSPVMVARSDDAGASWTGPVPASAAPRERVVAPSPAVGRTGELYVAYLDLGQDSLDYAGDHDGRGGEAYPGSWSLVVARSYDGGDTWTETVVERRLVPAGRLLAFFPPTPSVAVDAARGRVYLGFHDARLGDADVWVWASEDRGATFEPPVRVNDTARRDGTSQYLAQLDVAPAGRLDAVYYDRREDRANRRNHVSLQFSDDGGRSFGDRLRLTDTVFDSGIGFGSERGMPDLGSRIALTSTDAVALAVWADTRAGSLVSNKQDLAVVKVNFDRGRGVAPVRYLGMAAAVVGLLVLVALARRPAPARP